MHSCKNFIIYIALALTAIFIPAAMQLRALPEDINYSGDEQLSLRACPYISVSAEPSGDGEHQGRARLLGVLPIKSIRLKQTPVRYVRLCGTPIGIKLHTDGVMVAGTTDVVTERGNVNPGRIAGLRDGDIISRAAGHDIDDAGDLVEAVERSDGHPMTLEVIRDGKSIGSLTLTPVYSRVDNCYRAGIWVRDSTAGIGILTFADPESRQFGGLGHAICDGDTGVAMPISRGEITDVVLTDIHPGAKGIPGELVGYLGDDTLGSLDLNSEAGVYGEYTAAVPDGEDCPVAFKQEVREGAAKMLTTLPGADSPELFDIVIERINYNDCTPTRNMVIRVTDDRLLSVSGGIVQGMSGSPIVQDGKFVAAATHVFVNDPTRGYAIFAENMLAEAQKSQKSVGNAA